MIKITWLSRIFMKYNIKVGKLHNVNLYITLKGRIKLSPNNCFEDIYATTVHESAKGRKTKWDATEKINLASRDVFLCLFCYYGVLINSVAFSLRSIKWFWAAQHGARLHYIIGVNVHTWIASHQMWAHRKQKQRIGLLPEICTLTYATMKIRENILSNHPCRILSVVYHRAIETALELSSYTHFTIWYYNRSQIFW